MPEWLVEKGIGETRAALVEDGRIIEARIELDGTIPAGTIIEAKLIDVGIGGRNGIASDGGGTEYLIGHVPIDITQGAALNIEVARPAVPGPEPWKRPLAKATRDERRRPRSFAERLRSGGLEVRLLTLPAGRDELGEFGWTDLLDEARTGLTEFPGGSLGIFPTPAMTLIDVDGTLPLPELAIAGGRAAVEAIRRLDIGGSIGIDLPTIVGKDSRHSVAAAVDAILPKPFERTAVNGFGFLQIVRPRSRASLIELAGNRPDFEARALLRRSAFERSGAQCLVGHPLVIGAIKARPERIEALSRQVGGSVTLRFDPSLPIHGAYAEKA